MLDRSQTLDLDPHAVTFGEELRRVHVHPDAARRTGEDQISGAQRAGLGDELDQLLTTEDQVRGPAVLAELVVDPGAQAQVARIADLVSGGHPGAERTERVRPLGPGPLRLAALEVARGHVV